MLYRRCVVTTKFLYRAYRPSYTGYELGVFRADPAWARNGTARPLRRWELASADRLRRIRDVEKHFRSGDMADLPRPERRQHVFSRSRLRHRAPAVRVQFSASSFSDFFPQPQ